MARNIGPPWVPVKTRASPSGATNARRSSSICRMSALATGTVGFERRVLGSLPRVILPLISTAVDVVKDALKQLPGHQSGTRAGRKVLVRVDGAGSTLAFLDWMSGQRLSYSVGSGLPDHTPDVLQRIPENVWTPAYDAHDQVRDGAWVAELTDLLDLTGWPKGMRVIARKERPHPGAQLRLTDIDGLRVTAFATNTARGQLPDLELRHRRRARAEDRIRVCQGHRSDQPAAARLRPEPDLVRHHHAGRRAHRLDADARPARP